MEGCRHVAFSQALFGENGWGLSCFYFAINRSHSLAVAKLVMTIRGIRSISNVCRPRLEMLSSACAEIHRAPDTTSRPISTIRAWWSCTSSICTVTVRQDFAGGDICLHQVYVSTGGHYRLMKSYYDRNSDWSNLLGLFGILRTIRQIGMNAWLRRCGSGHSQIATNIP